MDEMWLPFGDLTCSTLSLHVSFYIAHIAHMLALDLKKDGCVFLLFSPKVVSLVVSFTGRKGHSNHYHHSHYSDVCDRAKGENEEEGPAKRDALANGTNVELTRLRQLAFILECPFG